MAIRIRTKKAEGNYDVELSKMLGNPVLLEGMDETLPSTAMFFIQIRLEDIKNLDNYNLSLSKATYPVLHKNQLQIYLIVSLITSVIILIKSIHLMN